MEDFEDSGVRRRLAPMATALVLLVLLAVGALGVYRFVENERERDLQAWQVRLGIVADSQAAAVDNWLRDQFGVVRGLADNASLQLYLSEVLAGADGVPEPDSAEAGYLRNLLVATADRAGFTGEILGPDVPANVDRKGVAGLALTDPQGNVVVATRAMPSIQGPLRQALLNREPGRPALIDLHRGVSGQPTIGFIEPIFGVQDDPGAGKEIGLVIGVRLADGSLYGLLKQPGETLHSAETILVRDVGGVFDYISPLRDGTEPLTRALAADTPQLAAAYVRDHPGGFAQRRDYAGTDVLVTGRIISGAPWLLLRKVDAGEALAEIDGRRHNLLALFFGALFVAGLVSVVVWRHGASVRASLAAHNYRTMAEKFERTSGFLRVVTDGQPTAIAAVDKEGRFRFTNSRAADGLEISADDMIGKGMASVIGPVKAKIYDRLNKQVMVDGETVSSIHKFEDMDGEHIVRSQHIPLAASPDEDGEGEPGVLMVLQDVTELVTERNRRERTLRQLISTLLTVVDRRDPYSAHHSARVAEVAKAVAGEMELSDQEIETAEIAAQLMNLGKIMVPEEVLTKTGRLTDDELKQVRGSITASADMLEGVEFDGPVVETLRQLQEHWGGGGLPNGLKGEEILLPARVVAVANAFVGMVSPRAYRSAIAIEEACDELRDRADIYDRRPVSALINIVDNRGGALRWDCFQSIPEGK